MEMRSLKFTIAAANPLLAEKLAAPTGQLQQHQHSSHNGHPQLAPLVPKIEKGKYYLDTGIENNIYHVRNYFYYLYNMISI